MFTERVIGEREGREKHKSVKCLVFLSCLDLSNCLCKVMYTKCNDDQRVGSSGSVQTMT